MKIQTILIFLIYIFFVPTQTVIANELTHHTKQINSLLVAKAGSGCCKQWDKRYKNWRIVGDNLPQCKKWNHQYDKDQLRSKKGFIWWDKGC